MKKTTPKFSSDPQRKAADIIFASDSKIDHVLVVIGYKNKNLAYYSAIPLNGQAGGPPIDEVAELRVMADRLEHAFQRWNAQQPKQK